jgi:hypothetical protein
MKKLVISDNMVISTLEVRKERLEIEKMKLAQQEDVECQDLMVKERFDVNFVVLDGVLYRKEMDNDLGSRRLRLRGLVPANRRAAVLEVS